MRQDQPGWINEQWKFWRGMVSAGAGPSPVPSPLAQPGSSPAATAANPTGVASTLVSASVGSQTYVYTLSASTVPVLLVARQPSRSFLTIQNNSAGTLSIFFGQNSINSTASTLALQIPGNTEYQARVNVPVDEIYGATSAVSVSGVILVGL